MSGLADFLEGLGQTPESSGLFTLDPERARQMLADLLLPGPEFHLLKLIQAAVASGAPAVEIKVGWFSLDIEFTPPQDTKLENLFGYLFDDRRPDLRHLAVGINCGLSKARAISVETGGRRHVFAGGSGWEEAAPSRHGVRVRLSRNRWDTTPETHLLHERCRWSPVPIRLNGHSLGIPLWGGPRTLAQSYLPGRSLSAPASSRAQHPPRVEARFAGRRVPCDMVVGLEPGPDNEVLYVQHGVIIGSRQVDLGVPGAVAVVGAEDLPTDLSGFQLLEGAELERRLEQVRHQVARLAHRVSPKEREPVRSFCSDHQGHEVSCGKTCFPPQTI